MFITDWIPKPVFLNFSCSKGAHVSTLLWGELHVLWLDFGLWAFFHFFCRSSHTKVTNCNQVRAWVHFIYMRHVFLLTGSQSGFLTVVEPKWNFLFCVGHFKAADILRCQWAFPLCLEIYPILACFKPQHYCIFLKLPSFWTETIFEVGKGK